GGVLGGGGPGGAPPPPRPRPKPPPPPPAPPPPPPPTDVGANGTKGFSMAELEQQAQRELERLGAQGVNIFKRTK
ncbi:MAG: hypothetical protein FWH21_09505, partial [Kiritimatiellaeota bacterium]|nr:hypothetical protein [Kiritimatiellota bacterium]